MNKYAGVVLDFYDDRCGTLKAKFPDVDSLPDIIKEADIKEKNKLANEDFALVAVDGGQMMRKFACHDPGTTAISVMYFMEHGDKLPDDAIKTAASNLVEKCVTYGILPPVALTKAAELEDVGDNIVDVTGQSPTPKVKVAAPESDEDYCYITKEGKRLYPINSWDLIERAQGYYLENQHQMHPEMRRQFSTKLAAKSGKVGFPLDEKIKEAGSQTYAGEEQRKEAVEMRKLVFDPHSEERDFLDDLFEKSASILPDDYAHHLRVFDTRYGLDSMWDQAVPDPWTSTFGIDKTAKVVWEEGADRVTDRELQNLAQNHASGMYRIFTDDILREFAKDPVGVFNSMPLPQKKIIARMGADLSASGGSEGYEQ